MVLQTTSRGGRNSSSKTEKTEEKKTSKIFKKTLGTAPWSNIFLYETKKDYFGSIAQKQNVY